MANTNPARNRLVGLALSTPVLALSFFLGCALGEYRQDQAGENQLDSCAKAQIDHVGGHEISVKHSTQCGGVDHPTSIDRSIHDANSECVVVNDDADGPTNKAEGRKNRDASTTLWVDEDRAVNANKRRSGNSEKNFLDEIRHRPNSPVVRLSVAPRKIEGADKAEGRK